MNLTGHDLTVRPYEPEDRSAWDDLVRRARAPHFMLTRGYLEYHADRFQDASVLVFEGSCAARRASRQPQRGYVLQPRRR